MKYLKILWSWIKTACLWVWGKLKACWNFLVKLVKKNG